MNQTIYTGKNVEEQHLSSVNDINMLSITQANVYCSLSEAVFKSIPVSMVAGPPNFRGDLNISDQNNLEGGDLSKKLNLGGGAKFKGDLKF